MPTRQDKQGNSIEEVPIAIMRIFRWHLATVCALFHAMTNHHLLKGILASLTIVGSGILPVSAQLPSLDKQPWIGYYAAFANKRFRFSVTPDGKMKLTPLDNKGATVGHNMFIPIEITIQEVSPDGKATTKQIKAESLQSAQPATEKIDRVTLTGKVTGDASFEIFIEQQRNVISIGGRLLDPGTLKKNPLNFAINVKFPDSYPNAEKNGQKGNKTFQKNLEGDRIDIKWTDGKRKKFKIEEKVDETAKEINGPGIASAEIDISAYKGRKIEFVASSNSSMKFWNAEATSLFEGFNIAWTADAAKDPTGKARLSFEVK
jgi:hypothetical protein